MNFTAPQVISRLGNTVGVDGSARNAAVCTVHPGVVRENIIFTITKSGRGPVTKEIAVTAAAAVGAAEGSIELVELEICDSNALPISD